MSQVPLPPSGQYFTSVRSSSKALRTEVGIKITQEAINRFLLSPAFEESFSRLNLSHGLTMPLQFPDISSELNIISVLSLLNFASAYRVPLHTATGRGAYDTIRALIFSLYLESSVSNNLLSAQGMKHITRERIAELMQVSIYIEKPHPGLPGVVLGELGGPIFELVELVAKVLNGTGEILVNSGYPDLGAFVAEALKAAKAEGDKTQSPPITEVVLERLVRAFPAFQDMYFVDNKAVYIFKKALFLIHAIRLRFQSHSEFPLPIPNTDDLPIFSDNVIPSMLVYLGVIDLSSCTLGNLSTAFPDPDVMVESLLSAAPTQPPSNLNGSSTAAPARPPPPKEGPILTHQEAYALRAAAIDACELIVQSAKTIELKGDQAKAWLRRITLPDLDGWIWAVAKDRKDYRSLPRFVEGPTVFF